MVGDLSFSLPVQKNYVIMTDRVFYEDMSNIGECSFSP